MKREWFTPGIRELHISETALDGNGTLWNDWTYIGSNPFGIPEDQKVDGFVRPTQQRESNVS